MLKSSKSVYAFFICAGLIISAADMCMAAEDASPYDTIEQMIEEADYKRAEDLLHDRLVTNDKDIVAISMLGEVYRRKGLPKKAVDILDKAVRIDPDYPEPYFVLAKAYLNMQQYDDADARIKIFKEKMRPFLGKDQPSLDYYLRALHYLSGEYLLLKKYDAFRSEIDEILRVSPYDQAAYYNMGVYYYHYKHDRSAAFQAFDKALKLDPDTPTGKKARYAIEFIRANSDSRIAPSFSFIDREYRD